MPVRCAQQLHPLAKAVILHLISAGTHAPIQSSLPRSRRTNERLRLHPHPHYAADACVLARRGGNCTCALPGTEAFPSSNAARHLLYAPASPLRLCAKRLEVISGPQPEAALSLFPRLARGVAIMVSVAEAYFARLFLHGFRGGRRQRTRPH